MPLGMRFLWLFTSLLCIGFAQHASAQQVPRSVQAGTIAKQIEERTPLPQGSDIIDKPYSELTAPEGSEKIRFILRGITIEGVNAYPPDSFSPYYAQLIGKEVSLADMYRLIDRIRRTYHDDGYVLTQVFLPEQTIGNGYVRIHVTEGYVSRIRWEGEVPDSALMRESADAITAGRPFRGKTLEEVMLRMNELPGVQAQAALEPLPKEKAAPGEVGIVITVARKRVGGSVNIDNYATRYVGVWQANAQLAANGLLCSLDQLSLNMVASADPDRMRYSGLKYALPVHSSGTTLTFSGSYSYTNPGFSLESLDIVSRARNFSVGVTQPVLRSREQSLSAELRFEMNNQNTNVLSFPFTEDRIRTLVLATPYQFSDGWKGMNYLQPSLTRGLNVFNATETGDPTLARARARSDFTKFNLTASRLQGIVDRLDVLVLATGQKASAAVPSSEQFGFGGQSFGRAYDGSEISGDDGVAVSVELRYVAAKGADWFVQPYVYYDIGKVWLKEPNAGPGVSAASAGVGARLQWDAVRLDTVIAQPLTYTPATPKLGAVNKDPRIMVSLSTSF